MITQRGKNQVGRFFGGAAAQLARGISVGIGSATPTANDTQLEFEVAIVQIESVTYDPVNQRPVFKATLPSSLSGQISEIGLWSDVNANPSGEFDSRTLVEFTDDTETWNEGSTFVAGGLLAGEHLRQSPAAGATVKDTISGNFDLSGVSGGDTLTVAYGCATATRPSKIRVRFCTDSANYLTFDLGQPTVGDKKFSSAVFSAGVATGSPNLANITYIEFETVAPSGAAAVLDWYGVKMKDTDPNDDNYVLVAREVITPYTIETGRVNEVEFALYLEFV